MPQIERLALSSRVPSYAAELLGAWAAEGPMRFFHDHVLVKEGGTRQRTPWHQDHWHAGHLPRMVLSGQATAREHYVLGAAPGMVAIAQ